MRIKNSNDITYFIGGILLLLTLRPFFTWSLSGSYAQIVFLFPLAILFWRNYRMNRLNVLYLFFFVFTLLLASISQNRNLIGFFWFFVKFGGNLFFISTVFFFLNPIKSCRYVCFLVTLKTPHH